jgi:type IV pilus assembly protein PilA
MKTCPYCAEAIPEDAQFCQFCGTSLTGNAAPLGPAAAPTAPIAPGQGPTSGKAIVSLICGIFSFVLPSAIVAVIFGHLSLSEIKRSAGRVRGRGMALTGLVLGYLGISVLPILIIAAIAIPNLLRARMAANEASAVGVLRTYNTAMITYVNACPKMGYPHSLANLGPGAGDCERAGVVDGTLGTDHPSRSGYYFQYIPAEPDGHGQVSGFTVTADPITENSTGVRHFYTDQTGLIRWSLNGAANADSPALE